MEKAISVSIFASSLPKKAAAALMGAVLVGTMWRIRGDTSFGGFWGMLAVATAFVLYIFALCGNSKKNSAEYFAFTAFMCAATNGGWGTLVTQITGSLNSSTEFSDGYIHFTEISPWSGIVIMLLLGFSWAPFLGAFLAIYFSPKKYSLGSFAELIVIYYALFNIFKATLAHPLLKLINPGAVSLFSEGLADKGVTLTPWRVYLENFSDMSFSKSIPAGRNYFTSIAVIAGALAVLVMILYFAVRFKDARASRFMLGSCTAFAAGITVADLFFLWQLGDASGTMAAHQDFAGWSFWEYFTGFIAGLILMLVILSQDSERVNFAARTELATFEKLPQPVTMLIQFLVTFLLPAASIVSPLSDGVNKLVDGTQIIVIIAGAVLFLAGGIYLVYRFMYRGEQSSLYPEPFSRTAKLLLPAYFAVMNLIYWFTGNAYALNPPVSPINIIMLVSIVLFAALYCTVFKNSFSIKEKPDVSEQLGIN